VLMHSSRGGGELVASQSHVPAPVDLSSGPMICSGDTSQTSFFRAVSASARELRHDTRVLPAA
jgi:hypothetical protein